MGAHIRIRPPTLIEKGIDLIAILTSFEWHKRRVARRIETFYVDVNPLWHAPGKPRRALFHRLPTVDASAFMLARRRSA